MKRLRQGIIATVLITFLVLGGIFSGVLPRPAQAVGIGSILKVGSVILVVSIFGHQINTIIHNALGQRSAAVAGATKVVPVFSVGSGAYIGAVQVVGMPMDVQATQGVAAIRVSIGNLSGTKLIPISTKKPSDGDGLSRVNGVGISEIIDLQAAR